jgi:hypothetical protein
LNSSHGDDDADIKPVEHACLRRHDRHSAVHSWNLERQKTSFTSDRCRVNHPTIADWVTVALARWRPLGFHAERTPFRNALAISSLSSGFREVMSSVAAAEKLDVEGARRRCAIRIPIALLGCENRILEQCWRSSLLAELWWDGGKTSGDVIARP